MMSMVTIVSIVGMMSIVRMMSMIRIVSMMSTVSMMTAPDYGRLTVGGSRSCSCLGSGIGVG